jgi:hypothetical protein
VDGRGDRSNDTHLPVSPFFFAHSLSFALTLSFRSLLLFPILSFALVFSLSSSYPFFGTSHPFATLTISVVVTQERETNSNQN